VWGLNGEDILPVEVIRVLRREERGILMKGSRVVRRRFIGGYLSGVSSMCKSEFCSVSTVLVACCLFACCSGVWVALCRGRKREIWGSEADAGSN
jgi:hypothetical protein